MAMDVGELLLKAVRSLDADEQDAVLSTLLSSAVTATAPPFAYLPSGGRRSVAAMRHEVQQRFFERLATEASEPGTWKVLPVRLAESSYDELKDWCQVNDFSMAVVVRELVDRFLVSTATRP